jgi:hypothetical protein
MHFLKKELNFQEEHMRNEDIHWVVTVLGIFIVFLWFAISERFHAGLNYIRTLIS